MDVDAAVLVEALVLDRHDRLLDERGDVLGRDDDPRLRAAEHRQHRAAVARVDDGVLLRLLLVVGVELGDLRRDRGEQAEREGAHPEQREHAEQREQPQLADAAPLTRPSPFPEERQSAG